jgi:hypothetical protein
MKGFSLLEKMFLAIVVLMLTAAPLLAQSEFPRAQVFGGYSYLSADTSGLSGRESLNGWNGQASVNLNRWLGLTADFGGYYGSPQGVTVHDFSYVFGPTLTYRAQHFAPFFHALFGGNHISGSAAGMSGSDNAFAVVIGGGLDLPFKSSWGLRLAQVDWLRTNHFSTSQNNVRVSTGVFFQFGK